MEISLSQQLSSICNVYSSHLVTKYNSPETKSPSSISSSVTSKFQTSMNKLSSSQTGPNCSNYDFNNMTHNEMLNTVNSLIKKGKMSVDESSSLLIMLPVSPLCNVNGSNAIPSSANTPINYSDL